MILPPRGHPGDIRRGVLPVAASAVVWSFGGLIARFPCGDGSSTIVFRHSQFAAAFLLAFMLVRDGPKGTPALLREIEWAGIGVDCSMSRSGDVWDNAAMESFFSSLKAERIGCKLYRTRDDAKADVFDYIERFYDTVRRHSTIGYLSPVEFERKAGLA